MAPRIPDGSPPVEGPGGSALQKQGVFMDIDYPCGLHFIFDAKWVRLAMGQTSRVVTIVDGVQVIEVTTHDPEGHPIETHYQVRGEKYETLQEARRAARDISESG